MFVCLCGLAWYVALQIRVGPDSIVPAVIERIAASETNSSGNTKFTAYARSTDGRLILLTLPPMHNCTVGATLPVVRSETLGGWRYDMGPKGCVGPAR